MTRGQRGDHPGAWLVVTWLMADVASGGRDAYQWRDGERTYGNVSDNGVAAQANIWISVAAAGGINGVAWFMTVDAGR
jgi:hypothetical protein